MRLSDFYDEPLRKLLQTMELKDVVIKVDDNGEIQEVEMKYTVRERRKSKNEESVELCGV